MCRIDDSDYVQELDRSTPTARKEHRCNECRRTIAPGETYELFKGIWDGRFAYYKTCTHCQQAREWLYRQCNGYVFTEVRDELEEHWRDEPLLRSWRLARLIAGMRHQWKHKGQRMAVPA
jgi:hypothetical protein